MNIYIVYTIFFYFFFNCMFYQLLRVSILIIYYNKGYQEGFPRECLLTAAVSESPNLKGEVIHSLPQ